MKGNCAECGVEFYRRSSNKKRCDICGKARTLERRRKNAEQWRIKNPEKSTKRRREWAVNNRERLKEYLHRRYIANRDRICAQLKLYKEIHHDALLEKRRASYSSEDVKNRNKKWRDANREKIAATAHRRRGAPGSFTADELKAKFKAMGNKCVHCGATDKLQVDHITPLKLGGTNYIDNIQPLCKTCNLRKKDRFIG